MFSELEHDFGTVARGADVRHLITVTNLYEEDVAIADVKTTCGCTAAKPDRTLLKTHEKAYIEVKMDTVKFMRQKDSNVDVTLTFHGAKGSARKTVRIPIHAYIRPDVVLTPGNVDFGSVEYGAGAERKVEIAYAPGRQDWAIRDVRVSNDSLEASVEETGRSSSRVHYVLSVRLKESARMGTLQEQVTLITNDSNAEEVPVLVFAQVEPDIVITPASLPFGTLKPGQTATRTLILRGKREFSIENIESKNTDLFEVAEVSEQTSRQHIIPLRIKAPAEPGEVKETFTITIAGRDEPLTCTASATVVGGT